VPRDHAGKKPWKQSRAFFVVARPICRPIQVRSDICADPRPASCEPTPVSSHCWHACRAAAICWVARAWGWSLSSFAGEGARGDPDRVHGGGCEAGDQLPSPRAGRGVGAGSCVGAVSDVSVIVGVLSVESL
jgi:hypothetical protein